MATQLKRLTSTGAAVAGDAYLKSVSLTAGDAAAASAAVSDGSGGATLLTLKAAAASTTVQWRSGDGRGVYFGTSVYVTLSGAGAEVTVEVD